MGWVHDVLGTEYLRLLAELQVPVQGGRRDPPGRRPSSRHGIHGEYVCEQPIVGGIAVLGTKTQPPGNLRLT